MGGTNVSSVYSRLVVEQLSALPEGRLSDDQLDDEFAKIIEGQPATKGRRRSVRERAKVIGAYVQHFMNRKGIILVSHYHYRSKIYRKGLDEVWLLRLYRNPRVSEAAFGAEFYSLYLTDNFDMFRDNPHAEVLFSKHAVERLYERHSDYDVRAGKKAFRKFVNAEIYCAVKALVEMEGDETEEDGAKPVPVDGGLFMTKQNLGGRVITTFVADSQLREDQEEFAKPGYGTWQYQQMEGGMTFMGERTKTLFDTSYRATKFGMWVHDGERHIKVPTILPPRNST